VERGKRVKRAVAGVKVTSEAALRAAVKGGKVGKWEGRAGSVLPGIGGQMAGFGWVREVEKAGRPAYCFYKRQS